VVHCNHLYVIFLVFHEWSILVVSASVSVRGVGEGLEGGDTVVVLEAAIGVLNFE
jgi:hypothetical protein